LLLLPLLGQIPMPVISGIFLYLGRKLMVGNQMLDRLGNIFCEKSKLRDCDVFRLIPTPVVVKFVGIQTCMLGLIWYLKQSASLSLFFPACIALLIFIRALVLPKLFTERQLSVLDSQELNL
jgi:HCO3- transporter family